MSDTRPTNASNAPVSPAGNGRNLFDSAWQGVKAAPGLGWQALQWTGWGLKTAAVASVRETIYWLRLFAYTSKRYLRIETYLSLLGALLFFGYIISNDMARNQRELLQYNYIYFTMVMVWLSSSLLPREREEGTLEILWSQPMGRGSLATLQLITLTVWCTLMCAAVVAFFSEFASYQEGRWTIILCVSTTIFAVGAITLLISTFTRHVIATALVALLIFGVHYFWLNVLGPLAMYPLPIPEPGAVQPRWGANNEPSLWVNRVIVAALAGFALDYLYRRLKRTAEWVT